MDSVSAAHEPGALCQNWRINICDPWVTIHGEQLLNDSLRFVVDNDEPWAGLTYRSHHSKRMSYLEKSLPSRLCIILIILLISAACNGVEANASPSPTESPAATNAPPPTKTQEPSETPLPTETPSPSGVASPTEILVMVTGSTLTRVRDGMEMVHVPQEAFMVVELLPGYFQGAAGIIQYHAAFNDV